MPVAPTYPGVYIEEVPSTVRTIIGVPTAITAFVGRARKGPVDGPASNDDPDAGYRRITGWADFERIYGGLWAESPMSYAVYQYFQNGGAEAVIVRLHNGAVAATIALPGGVELTAR